jgi:hypothetical protein
MAKRTKESEAASLLGKARWAKTPQAERSALMSKVRAARSNAPGGRGGGRPPLPDRCYCGLKSWKSGVSRRFDCCKRAGKFPGGKKKQ